MDVDRRSKTPNKKNPVRGMNGRDSDCKAISLLGGAYLDLTTLVETKPYGFVFVAAAAGFGACAPVAKTAFVGAVLIVYAPDGSVISL